MNADRSVSTDGVAADGASAEGAGGAGVFRGTGSLPAIGGGGTGAAAGTLVARCRSGDEARGGGEGGAAGGAISLVTGRGASCATSADAGSARAAGSSVSARIRGGDIHSAATCTRSDRANATQITRTVITSSRTFGPLRQSLMVGAILPVRRPRSAALPRVKPRRE